MYGNEQLSSVVHVDHFEELLIRNDCDIDSVPLEWVELKIHDLYMFPVWWQLNQQFLTVVLRLMTKSYQTK